jgi:hypothetical protein
MKALFTLLALFAAFPAAATQAEKFGPYEVHYNAMPASDLRPEVAKTYNIERSRTRGLLTISVLKKNPMGIAEPVTAKVGGNIVNQYSQLSSIDLREIREGNAIYYLGEFRVAPPDTLRFSVQVTPDGEKRAYNLEFRKQFFP